MFRYVVASVALFNLAPVFAGPGLDRLSAFTTTMVSFSGDFTQIVFNAKSKPIQESSGSLVLKRPGKFHWNYLQPSPQLIVADGKKIWIYDEDLAQVTVKTIDESLGATPIMLLGGDQNLKDEFKIVEVGEREGVEWLELEPLDKDTDFEKIYMGLDEQGLVAMELRDNFGQATQIQFSDITVNGDVDDALFEFTPAEGVDVVGQ